MDLTRGAVPCTTGTRAATLLDRLWRASPPLTAVGTLILVVTYTDQ